MTMDFAEWVRGELEKRGWSQNELARQAGLTSAGISRMMTGMRDPGVDLCQGIARAFGIPQIIVFERAGLLSPSLSSTAISLRELWALMRNLPISEQRAIVAEARARYETVHGQHPEPANATS
jgi:transcriptional regulator with XRE-family HTH domain